MYRGKAKYVHYSELSPRARAVLDARYPELAERSAFYFLVEKDNADELPRERREIRWAGHRR